MNYSIKQRLRHGDFVDEEGDDGFYHVAGLSNCFDTLEDAIDYVEALSKNLGVEQDRAREAAPEIRRSGEEMEEAWEVLERIKSIYH